MFDWVLSASIFQLYALSHRPEFPCSIGVQLRTLHCNSLWLRLVDQPRSQLTMRLYSRYTIFFISNPFISNARLKLAKNQTDTKQHPEAKLLLFDIIHILHQRYHPKAFVLNRTYCKKIIKKTSVSVFMRL